MGQEVGCAYMRTFVEFERTQVRHPPMVPSVCVDGFTAERDATVDAFYPMLQCLNAAGKLCWYLDPMEAQRLSFIQRNNK